MTGLAVYKAINFIIAGPDQRLCRGTGTRALYLPNPLFFHCLTAFPTVYSHIRVPSFQKIEKKFFASSCTRAKGPPHTLQPCAIAHIIDVRNYLSEGVN